MIPTEGTANNPILDNLLPFCIQILNEIIWQSIDRENIKPEQTVPSPQGSLMGFITKFIEQYFKTASDQEQSKMIINQINHYIEIQR